MSSAGELVSFETRPDFIASECESGSDCSRNQNPKLAGKLAAQYIVSSYAIFSSNLILILYLFIEKFTGRLVVQYSRAALQRIRQDQQDPAHH